MRELREGDTEFPEFHPLFLRAAIELYILSILQGSVFHRLSRVSEATVRVAGLGSRFIGPPVEP